MTAGMRAAMIAHTGNLSSWLPTGLTIKLRSLAGLWSDFIGSNGVSSCAMISTTTQINNEIGTANLQTMSLTYIQGNMY